MPKMIEISAAEYERLQDCIREDGMRIAALIEENKALHQDAKHLRENIVKLRRRYPEGFEVERSIGKGVGTVMGDLIDRDALGVGPANPEVFKNTAYADGWNALLRIINQAPAVDAAPVVHGQWIGEADGYADGELVYDVWNCLKCDYCIDDGTDNPELLPNYCPNCGAKMDEEGDAE